MNRTTLAKENTAQDKILTEKHLLINNPETHERGQQTPDGKSFLIRFPELERIVWEMPLKLVSRNPFQPREDFPPDEITKMIASLEAVGQQDPISVIPIISTATKEKISLILLDGEIRTRAKQKMGGKQILDGIVKWEPDNSRLFERSAVMNLVRTGHNPIELAKIFRKLLDQELEKGATKKEAMKRVKESMKTNDFTIYSHLQLLGLSEEIQQLIRKRQITATAAFLIPQAKKRLGDKLDEALLAQELLKQAAGIRRGRPKKEKKEPKTETPTDQEQKRDSSPEQERKITRSGVKEALREVRIRTFAGEEVPYEEKNAIMASQNVVRWGIKITELIRASHQLLEEALRPATIKAMRERGHTPPETQYEYLEKLLKTLQAAHDNVLRPALSPDALEIPQGAPKFTEVIKKIAKNFKDQTVYEIAVILANASDDKGKILTSIEICEALKKREICLSPQSTGPIFRSLIATLKQKGLTLDTQEKRKRTEDGYLKKIPGYRLRWIKKGETIKDMEEE